LLKTSGSSKTVCFGGNEWRVLEIKTDMMLVVSEKILSTRAYNTVDEAITWERSEMRRYLNGEFYNTFSTDDKNRIIDTKIINSDNPKYNTAGGNDTIDKIFLLSLDEAERYFADNSARTTLTNEGDESHWWLRSPGCEPTTAAYVEYDGVISYGYGHWSGVSSVGGVRPAMWLKL